MLEKDDDKVRCSVNISASWTKPEYKEKLTKKSERAPKNCESSW